jgi:hypothetical protein
VMNFGALVRLAMSRDSMRHCRATTFEVFGWGREMIRRKPLQAASRERDRITRSRGERAGNRLLRAPRPRVYRSYLPSDDRYAETTTFLASVLNLTPSFCTTVIVT